MNIEKQKYPIGKYNAIESFDSNLIHNFISSIEYFPSNLRTAVEPLNDTQLDTPYRVGGWTIRQVIHHCADSHMNSFIRFKLALTEDNPTIKPYDENLWAELSDAKTLPISSSLQILDGLHLRWTILLKSMTEDDFKRTFYHPINKTADNLFVTLSKYAWHSDHHLAQIKYLIERMNW